MKVKLEFTLNKAKFGVIDRAIFQLVLNSCTSIKDIKKYLFIFNKNVIAKAICNLVNNQIIIANIPQKTLTLSSPVSALYELTKNQLFDLSNINEAAKQDEVHENIINKNDKYFNKSQSEYILDFILPNVDLTYYVNLLKFYKKQK
jgi:hypothetical protein